MGKKILIENKSTKTHNLLGKGDSVRIKDKRNQGPFVIALVQAFGNMVCLKDNDVTFSISADRLIVNNKFA